jgi:hypothetical protein
MNAPKALIRNVDRSRHAAVTRLGETHREDGGDRRSRDDQEAPPLDDISERPRRNGEQEDRQAGSDLHERDDQRIRTEARHHQLEAALYIHVPIFAARLAVQITVKAGWRKGLQAEARGGAACPRRRIPVFT